MQQIETLRSANRTVHLEDDGESLYPFWAGNVTPEGEMDAQEVLRGLLEPGGIEGCVLEGRFLNIVPSTIGGKREYFIEIRPLWATAETRREWTEGMCYVWYRDEEDPEGTPSLTLVISKQDGDRLIQRINSYHAIQSGEEPAHKRKRGERVMEFLSSLLLKVIR